VNVCAFLVAYDLEYRSHRTAECTVSEGDGRFSFEDQSFALKSGALC
jgi:hypothetical protein